MNILSALFGIFRQRGLVSTIKEGRSLTGFAIAAVVFSIIGGLLYGFAMGIGLGLDTAIKDAIKIGLIIALVLLLSLPIFWVAFRLLGREERMSQVTAIPLTSISTVAIILAVTAPVVFLLSVLAGYSPDAVYIHIVIIDLAVMVGLYLGGTLIFHSFSDHRRIVIPNVIGFLMMGVILVVLMSFFGPFLVPTATFSVGTDRLKDGLGIGVADKVENSLAAAASAERLYYRFQTTNDNGDLVQDYSMNRVGADYLIEVHQHNLPGEPFRNDQHIWILDGITYSDFNEGMVIEADSNEIASFLDPALPAAVFSLPMELTSANWRAFERGNLYTATGTGQSLSQVTAEMDTNTGRLTELIFGSAEQGLHSEVRAMEIATTETDRIGIEASLYQAMVTGAVDRSDASMQDYIQNETLFVVRYPRNWNVGVWSSTRQSLELSANCATNVECPSLKISVFSLEEGKGAQQYAGDLAQSLGNQPEYREITVSTKTLGDESVGVVEYLFDQIVRGRVETTRHVEYIFVGQENRYHLDFSMAEDEFSDYQTVFTSMAEQFTFLGEHQ